MKNEGSISIFHSYSCGLVQLDWDSSILSGSNGLSVHYNIRLGTMVSNYDSSVTLILPRVLSNEGFVSDHLCPYAVPLYSCPGCRRGEWGYRAPCNSFKSLGFVGLMYTATFYLGWNGCSLSLPCRSVGSCKPRYWVHFFSCLCQSLCPSPCLVSDWVRLYPCFKICGSTTCSSKFLSGGHHFFHQWSQLLKYLWVWNTFMVV